MDRTNVEEMVVNPFHLLLPTTRKEREKFLRIVRERVEFYVPRMEEITGVDFGQVDVKDYKFCFEDIYQKQIQGVVSEFIAERELSGLEKASIVLPAKIIEYITNPFFWLYINAGGCEMKYHNSSIYVSFGFQNKFFEFNRRRRLDQTVVHELSHHLWHKVGGEYSSKTFDRRWKLWNEGFATYCAEEYFLPAYQNKTTIEELGDKIYREGKKKIEEIVGKHGKEIILEVPRKWREFDGDEK